LLNSLIKELPLESPDEEIRQRVAELLRESATIREQLRAARKQYRSRFQELSARLLLQTRTWRSFHIHKRKTAIEITALQQKCNDLMEEFVKIETLRIEEQRDLMQLLSELPPSDAVAKAALLERVNQFNLHELAEGLTSRWQLLDQIEVGVEKVEDFVRARGPKKV
jgi:hypothetical protein